MIQRTLVLAMVCALVVLAAPVAPAQADDKEGTLTGCLNGGDTDGHFVLTTEDGQEVMVMGGDELAAHAENHEVELTGKWIEDAEGNKHFEAAGVAHQGICD
jgi:hypothetical protein